jgi:FkbM family methyltransferase
MDLRATALELANSKVARLAVKGAQRGMDVASRLSHPDLPPDRQITKVSYGDKHFEILHRHTEADRGVIRQCFTKSQYDVPTSAHGSYIDRVYQEIVASGSQPLIFDCGSHIGVSVLWYSARYPKAHILAIEPAPDNFALLKHNTANLDVDVRQAGIAATDGVASLVDPGTGSWGYQTSTVSGNGDSNVPMLAIGTLLASKIAASYVPFILKIDIEGSEKSLFDGDPSSLNQFPLILIELHDWMLVGQHSSLGFFRFHAAMGRECAILHENLASIAINESPSAFSKP